MTVYFRPCGALERAPTPRGTDDQALYALIAQKTGLSIEIDPSVDYEDWIEPASMLAAAIKMGLEIAVLAPRRLEDAIADPVAQISGAPTRDMLIGRMLKTDTHALESMDFGWPARDLHLANHYAELETFHAHAGRAVALADMPGDASMAGARTPAFGRGLTSRSLGEALLSFAPEPAIVKQVYPAKVLPLLLLQADATMTPREAESGFFDEVGFHFARFEGDPAALLVQERITMTHETRFLVIGGQLVTGAACIEANTPQQNPTDAALPLYWEYRRNSGDMDDRSPHALGAIGSRLWRFAEARVADIRAEAPALRNYTLDLALDANGTPLIIEINPAANAGLYAISARRLMAAILAESRETARRPAERPTCEEPAGSA